MSFVIKAIKQEFAPAPTIRDLGFEEIGFEENTGRIKVDLTNADAMLHAAKKLHGSNFFLQIRHLFLVLCTEAPIQSIKSHAERTLTAEARENLLRYYNRAKKNQDPLVQACQPNDKMKNIFVKPIYTEGNGSPIGFKVKFEQYTRHLNP